MSNVATNKDLVVRFVDAGNKRDMDALDELWVTWDNLDIMVQLGHMDPPPPSAS